MQAVPGVSLMAALLADTDIDLILGGQPATLFAPTDDALLREAARRQMTLPELFNSSGLVDAIARCEMFVRRFVLTRYSQCLCSRLR